MENPSKYLGNELEYLRRVLESENWSATSGNWNSTLERAFAKKFGVKYAIAMNSGTSTLHAALEAAGVGPGDEVISPAMSVVMDSAVTIHANAVPVYADIDPETFTISPDDIRRKITPKTKAIITVSLYGLSPDMDPIMELAQKHNLFVLEDNAQCYLSKYKGKLTGTIGHMASYSFESSKHLSCGEGGMLITNNEEYAEIARKTAGNGYKNLKAEEGRVKLNADVFQDPDYKRIDTLGWNYRMPEFNAAVAMAQLERIDELLEMRKKSAELFLEAIGDCDFLTPQKIPAGYTNSYYTFGVLYEGKEKIGVSWKDFRKEYINQGGDGYYGACAVNYLEPMLAERKFAKRCPWVYKDIKYEKGICPVAEKIQPKLMQLKTNYRDMELAKQKAEALRKTILKFSK